MDWVNCTLDWRTEPGLDFGLGWTIFDWMGPGLDFGLDWTLDLILDWTLDLTGMKWVLDDSEMDWIRLWTAMGSGFLFLCRGSNLVCMASSQQCMTFDIINPKSDLLKLWSNILQYIQRDKGLLIIILSYIYMAFSFYSGMYLSFSKVST